ncbi:type IV pilus assembly protein PilY1 [Halopseudomonas litoralis]|uniref:Type IV pilus assembly protein PilY1 n=1 Tax=Halopseudomonas litoralis TaxID=797277 RepID=A0A1H1TZ35_9GAMM|nr:PilC/PilY family type IV pilus protein [Halopseudomonas litoralis]SDS65535.1 type IV pilus assembly protein PilY1 [Halopseudomonas litoralis]
MKLLTHVLPTALFTSMLCLSSLAYADDTEIYFAQANADNEENRSVANVLIMIDTSGSMRFCQNELSTSGHNATWCSNAQNRRINILQNALDQLLDSVSPSIRLGIGRYNYRTSSSSGQRGGRILVPVTELNNDTRTLIRSQLETLNGAGNNSSGGANAQPVGDTPTARAFSEAARYMMGMAPVFGSTANGQQPSVCAAEEEVETNCRDVVVYGDPSTVDFCDITSNEYQCIRGTYQNLPDWQFCDLNSDDCRLRNSWTSWTWNESCDHTLSWCDRRERGLFIRYYEYQHQRFEQRRYTQRIPTGAIERVCSRDVQCTAPLTIIENNHYVSPMNLNNQCETNHIILFTDGAPSPNDQPGLDDVVSSNCVANNTGSYTCQTRIASYLNSTSNAKGREVFTHNIGLYMGNNEANMKAVSDAGAGSTANADNAEQLIAAFLANLDLIDEQARSISAPGVAVNTQSRFQHLDELFYSAFQPAESSYWEGNLKKYKWSAEEDADGNVEGEIQGVGGSNAIDPDTGYFRDGARSFWSNEVDGNDVTKGGARVNIPAERRLFYTSEVEGNISQLTWTNTSTPANTLLGLEPDDETARTAVFQRLKTMWADPLHSVPVIVNYNDDDPYANVAFISTNGGMLHAIDTKTGTEKFAFMPYEFLSQAERYTTDRPGLLGNKRQTYGLDGSWVAWQRSAEQDGKVYLYGGMRRGGQHYYALDVTDPEQPKMLWQISPESSGFAKLGQTWSTPTLTQVWTGGEAVPALVFGGGYSPLDHDDYASRSTEDQMGNGIYIVNAVSGDLLWSAGGDDNFTSTVADMKWAIPSSIAVVDKNFDGVADHLYFGDLGGQVFRADLPGSDDGSVQIVRIADLGGASGASQRRFYEAPAVAYDRVGGEEALYVAISSGYRAHPLNETAKDGIFIIRDQAAMQGGGNTLATVNNMTNVVSSSAANNVGWYYLFSEDSPDRSGEKAMSSPVIFDGKILQSTYAPTRQDDDDNPCAVRYGAAFLHTIDLRTGAPAALTGEAPANRSRGLDQSTPPPTPSLLVDEEGNLITVIGTEPTDPGNFGNPDLRRHRWMQLPRNEANTIKAGASGGNTEEGGAGL